MLSKIKNKSTKLAKKVLRKKDEVPLRITSETIDIHRENVISGGRKFKYPMQYAKHKLVYNALIILLSVSAVFGLIVWWQLYKIESTNDFFYRVSRIVPIPVAVIDGELVPYKDYLMKFKSSIHYLQNIEKVDLNNEDGKAQISYFKTQSMHEALSNAYARKIINQNNISINTKDVDNLIKKQRTSSTGEVSQQTYNTVILDYYNWTEDEYKYAIENILIRQTAAFFVDDEAKNLSNQINTLVRAGNTNLADIANNYKSISSRPVEFVDSGLVPKNNNDGGLAQKASELTINQVSEIFKSPVGDGYYFIKLIDINESKIRYQYIKVPLKTFNDKVSELEKSNKVQYYIKMP